MKGRLDIAFVSNVPMTLISEELAIPSSAYLFENAEQGTCVAHEHLAGVLGDQMDGAGVVPLTWMEVAFFRLLGQVTSVEDLTGEGALALEGDAAKLAVTFQYNGRIRPEFRNRNAVRQAPIEAKYACLMIIPAFLQK